MTNDENTTPEVQKIAANCTKCKILLEHTVVAYDAKGIIKTVKCLTCGDEHKYTPEKIKAPRKKTVRAVKFDPARDFGTLIEKFKGKKPMSYAMTGLFKSEDVIDHKTFGMGIVIGTTYKQMEVIFSDGPRILVYDRKEFDISGQS